MRNKVSILKGARNMVVRDSYITVCVDPSKQKRLDRLFDKVAPNAILNAGGRADEVRCYPGTREEVIEKVEKWMDGQGEEHQRFMWLSGPAGAGKSAIVQTIAERSQKRGIHAANFFFFRGDRTRNHAQPLVATLVYQLLRFHPTLQNHLVDCLTAMPLAYRASTEEQFLRLMASPIHMIQESSSICQPIILIIDGLDECNDERKQEQVVRALHALVEQNNSPFRVLVASRAEHHLVMSFNKIGALVESIFLDSEYRPQDDIRRFVIAKFEEIKRVHSLAHTLDEHWPANTDIEIITNKSSGQFIYAATVMRFIEYSPASPALSLPRVHGVRPDTGHSPLAQLDAVYSYIFSRARDIQTVKLILGAHFINQLGAEEYNRGIRFSLLMRYGGFEAIQIESILADLVAIVGFTPGPYMELLIYHASLYDYLYNESRSSIYYIDAGAIGAEWTSICLNKMDNHESLWVCISALMRVERTTPELSKFLLVASKQKLAMGDNDAEVDRTVSFWNVLKFNIYRLYFGSDRALYKRMLRRWIRFAYINQIPMAPGSMGTFEYGYMTHRMYYNWYLLTEGAKSALRLYN